MPGDKEVALLLLDEITSAPFSFKRLSGPLRGIMSARFGSFRILYAIDEPRKEVILLAVKPRERVYE
jgi:mRNA-degrading endonuclease RelE of RelBE toxin-antitoxin system